MVHVPPCWGPRGPFNRLGYMDDTTWCIDSEDDLPVFADNLQRAGLLTNLFSSGPKQLLVIATYEGFQLTFRPHAVYIGGVFRPHAVYMGGSRMLLYQGPGYIRLVSRHLFPHVYHKVDKTKLLSANRRASRVLAMVRLPANYPYQMYVAVAGGQQRWQAGARPPRTMYEVVVVNPFLRGYQKQLRHANVMVRCSTQHGLYEAMQRFHPDMPCV